MISKSSWKLLAAAISLASLAFIAVFRRLLFPAGDRYFESELPTLEMGSVLVSVAAITFIFFGIQLLRRHSTGTRVQFELDLLFVALGLMCFGAMSGELIGWFWPLEYEYIHFQLPVAVGIICFLIPRRDLPFFARSAENLRSIAMIFFPIAVLMIGNTIFQIVSISEGEFAPKKVERHLEAAGPGPIPKRVVWMIFDELDESAITLGPGTKGSDSLNKLRSMSFTATNAFPPNNATQKSIPSLLTGRQVAVARPVSVDQMEVGFSESEELVGLSETDNIFKDTKELGGTSGIVGWYHPYSRIFKNDVAAAYWHPDAVSTCFSLRECVSQTLAIAFSSLPFPNPFEERKQFKFQGLFSEERIYGQTNRIPEMRKRATELAGDSRLDLLYLHFSYPHAPYFGKDGRQTDSYFTSLELVNETIADIQNSITASGLEGETTLIVSSDHWWRMKNETDFAHLSEQERAAAVADLRVPFIVKFGGNTQPLEYPKPFNTLITRYIVSAILKGEVKTSTELAEWIDRFSVERPELVNAMPNPNENWLIAGDRE